MQKFSSALVRTQGYCIKGFHFEALSRANIAVHGSPSPALRCFTFLTSAFVVLSTSFQPSSLDMK